MMLLWVRTIPSVLGNPHHRQRVFLAEQVRQFSDTVIILRVWLMVLVTIQERNRVDDEVIMDMQPVHMGSDNNLEILPIKLLGKLHTNLVGLLWGDLPGCEGLLHVIPLAPCFFSKSLLCGCHIMVDFFSNIVYDIQGGNPSTVFRLCRVHHILDCFIKTVRRPYLRRGHSPVPTPLSLSPGFFFEPTGPWCGTRVCQSCR